VKLVADNIIYLIINNIFLYLELRFGLLMENANVYFCCVYIDTGISLHVVSLLHIILFALLHVTLFFKRLCVFRKALYKFELLLCINI